MWAAGHKLLALRSERKLVSVGEMGAALKENGKIERIKRTITTVAAADAGPAPKKKKNNSKGQYINGKENETQ